MVDFGKPLEAVHRDGRIGGVEPHCVSGLPGMAYGGMAGVGHPDAFLGGWRDDGSPIGVLNEWTLRNPQPQKTLEQRMEDLVRRVAETSLYADTSWAIDARSIVTELDRAK